jgi:hypothetical protein
MTRVYNVGTVQHGFVQKANFESDQDYEYSTFYLDKQLRRSYVDFFAITLSKLARYRNEIREIVIAGASHTRVRQTYHLDTEKFAPLLDIDDQKAISRRTEAAANSRKRRQHYSPNLPAKRQKGSSYNTYPKTNSNKYNYQPRKRTYQGPKSNFIENYAQKKRDGTLPPRKASFKSYTGGNKFFNKRRNN